MASSERITQIRDWDVRLRRGESIAGAKGYDMSLVLAIIRRIHGLNADSSDEQGDDAMAEVCAALSAGGEDT